MGKFQWKSVETELSDCNFPFSGQMLWHWFKKLASSQPRTKALRHFCDICIDEIQCLCVSYMMCNHRTICQIRSPFNPYPDVLFLVTCTFWLLLVQQEPKISKHMIRRRIFQLKPFLLRSFSSNLVVISIKHYSVLLPSRFIHSSHVLDHVVNPPSNAWFLKHPNWLNSSLERQIWIFFSTCLLLFYSLRVSTALYSYFKRIPFIW